MLIVLLGLRIRSAELLCQTERRLTKSSHNPYFIICSSRLSEFEFPNRKLTDRAMKRTWGDCSIQPEQSGKRKTLIRL